MRAYVERQIGKMAVLKQAEKDESGPKKPHILAAAHDSKREYGAIRSQTLCRQTGHNIMRGGI